MHELREVRHAELSRLMANLCALADAQSRSPSDDARRWRDDRATVRRCEPPYRGEEEDWDEEEERLDSLLDTSRRALTAGRIGHYVHPSRPWTLVVPLRLVEEPTTMSAPIVSYVEATIQLIPRTRAARISAELCTVEIPRFRPGMRQLLGVINQSSLFVRWEYGGAVFATLAVDLGGGDPVEALQRATRTFSDHLRHVWLAIVCASVGMRKPTRSAQRTTSEHCLQAGAQLGGRAGKERDESTHHIGS